MRWRFTLIVSAIIFIFSGVAFTGEKKVVVLKKLPSLSQQRRELTSMLNHYTRFHWDIDFSLYVIYYSPDVVEPWVRFKQLLNKWNQEKAEKFRESFVQQLRIGRASAFLITIINNSYKPIFLRPLSKRLMLVYDQNVVFPIYYEPQLDSPLTGVVQGLVFFPPIPENTSSFELKFADLPSKGESVSLRWVLKKHQPPIENLVPGRIPKVIPEKENKIKKTTGKEEMKHPHVAKETSKEGSKKRKIEVHKKKAVKTGSTKALKKAPKKKSVVKAKTSKAVKNGLKKTKTSKVKKKKIHQKKIKKPKLPKVVKKPAQKKPANPKIYKPVKKKTTIAKPAKKPVEKFVYEYRKKHPESPISVKASVKAVKRKIFSPSDVAKAYLKAWIAGDYRKMYQFLAFSSKKRIKFSDFRKAIVSLHVSKSFLSGLKLVRAETKRNSSRVIFKFTSRLLFVKISKLKVFYLVKENDKWGIVWKAR